MSTLQYRFSNDVKIKSPTAHIPHSEMTHNQHPIPNMGVRNAYNAHPGQHPAHDGYATHPVGLDPVYGHICYSVQDLNGCITRAGESCTTFQDLARCISPSVEACLGNVFKVEYSARVCMEQIACHLLGAQILRHGAIYITQVLPISLVSGLSSVDQRPAFALFISFKNNTLTILPLFMQIFHNRDVQKLANDTVHIPQLGFYWARPNRIVTDALLKAEWSAMSLSNIFFRATGSEPALYDHIYCFSPFMTAAEWYNTKERSRSTMADVHPGWEAYCGLAVLKHRIIFTSRQTSVVGSACPGLYECVYINDVDFGTGSCWSASERTGAVWSDFPRTITLIGLPAHLALEAGDDDEDEGDRTSTLHAFLATDKSGFFWLAAYVNASRHIDGTPSCAADMR